ncbi:MAG: hypothetical protein KKA07_04195 [Bacteroidetes bacterium]|nr:hypothetical protein [Bacteroidota bacterium]MBU1718252.1 hypothetical protein [Bacteroidota bacterium]
MKRIYLKILVLFFLLPAIVVAQSKNDKIYKLDESFIEAKVLKVDEENKIIVYKPASNLRAPNDTISIFEVSVIVYRTGEFRTFNTDTDSKKKYRNESGWDFKVKKEEHREFKIKGAAHVKAGVGFSKVENYNYARSLIANYDRKIGDMIPIYFGLDVGISYKFMLGGLLNFDKQRYDVRFGDSIIVELKDVTTYFALVGRYYPKVKSEKFKVFLVGGMNYIFRTDENSYYDITGGEKRWSWSKLDSDVYVGWVARAGLDILFTPGLGCSIDAGWGPTLLNTGVLLKL